MRRLRLTRGGLQPNHNNIAVQNQQRGNGKDLEPFLDVLHSPQVSPRLYLTVVQMGGIGRWARIGLAWLALHTVAAEMSRTGGEPTESSSCERPELEMADTADSEACKRSRVIVSDSLCVGSRCCRLTRQLGGTAHGQATLASRWR